MDLVERLNAPGPKRILALDGGGIRGAITLGFLERIEQILRERHDDEKLLLCDYFDLIGGTSTGSIIAAGLAIGMTASELKERYLELGGEVFAKKKWRPWEAVYSAKPLDEQLRKFFGNRTLGDPEVRTGLCVVTKRADTNSVWPLINHPNGKYYPKNRDILLRQAVRASTAAPVAFVPAKLEVGDGESGAFVDGGVSMANNPALQLFLVATLQGFPFRWPAGADELLLVSVGTGRWDSVSDVDDVMEPGFLGPLKNATRSISLLMGDASAQNELLLQALSRSPTRRTIDREIGDLGGERLVPAPLLHYLRYNVELDEAVLREYGLEEDASRAADLRNMAAAENRQALARVGDVVAAREAIEGHFPAVFDVDPLERDSSAVGLRVVGEGVVERILDMADPVARNEAITLFYHDVAVQLSRTIGGPDVTWFGFGTWASQTAGEFIRGEGIPGWADPLISDSPYRPIGRAAGAFVSGLRSRMAEGNVLVFKEVAPAAVAFARLLRERRPDREINAFLATLRPGATADGGQDLLRTALWAWRQAAVVDSSDDRAELVLLGNLCAVYHEQQRLQPILADSLQIPIVDALLGSSKGAERPSLLSRGVLRAVDSVLKLPRGEWRRFVTRLAMQYELPASSVRVGRDVDPASRENPFPAPLLELRHERLLEIWEDLASGSQKVAGSAASDWSQLPSRMRFIATLFRARQQDRGLLALPFGPRDADAIRAGRGRETRETGQQK